MRRTGLVRPDESTRSGPGVCAALANKLGVDATLVRVGVVVLTLFGGFGLLAYGLAWLLFPQADGHIHAEDMLGGRFTSGGVGSLIAIFFGFGGFGRWWWEPGGSWGALIAVLSIAGVVALVVWGVQQNRRPRPGRGPGDRRRAVDHRHRHGAHRPAHQGWASGRPHQAVRADGAGAATGAAAHARCPRRCRDAARPDPRSPRSSPVSPWWPRPRCC